MGRVVGAAVILITAAGLLVATWPQLLGLEQTYLVRTPSPSAADSSPRPPRCWC
ncbi:hypothetical protein [Clavibacter zhangzhiyongii]|uniref:hypothetical protein n=1 Tax=Clavibacter zhangzhiyongii TaxID=2768071 RepID=UPI001F3BECB3|nr:hypothetical protein [Clavibacter zhangzhiyongii]